MAITMAFVDCRLTILLIIKINKGQFNTIKIMF